jgi:hypothetical protein
MNNNVTRYIKAVLLERWWVYAAFLPEVIDIVTTFLDPKTIIYIPFSASIVFFVILLQIASFQAWNELYNPVIRPRIILDYDLESFGVCYLQIRNIGGDHARNINISFDPNIKLLFDEKEKLINEMEFTKKIEFLAMNNPIRFLFGTFGEQKDESNILQRFIVKITYKDSRLEREFSEEQILDPRQFLETTPKLPPHYKIAENLKDITKEIKDLVEVNKKQLDSWKNGLLIRNGMYINLSIDEKVSLVINIIRNGTKHDTWLNPHTYDFEYLLKNLRDHLLLNRELSNEVKMSIEKLNSLIEATDMKTLGQDLSDEWRELASILEKMPHAL